MDYLERVGAKGTFGRPTHMTNMTSESKKKVCRHLSYDCMPADPHLQTHTAHFQHPNGEGGLPLRCRTDTHHMRAAFRGWKRGGAI